MQIRQRKTNPAGALIVNADDWGRDVCTTQRALECVHAGVVSSVSAMVFMENSERAADIAVSEGIDTGLHLNLTAAFTARRVPPKLVERQQRVARYLNSARIAQVLYHPGLARSFEYVVAAQIAEYARLYGERPLRIDGHHHMHLSENVVMAGLLPEGTIVRRNFSFAAGEKGFANRWYRRFMDSRLAVRHVLTDFFFSLAPLQPVSRLEKICLLAAHAIVEVETHPVKQPEYDFLMRGELLRLPSNVSIAKNYTVRTQVAPGY